MDPFALQDEARRNTGRLVVLAVVAVSAVVAAAAFVFACGAWVVVSLVVKEEILPFGPFLAKPDVAGFSLIASGLIVFVGFLVKLDDLASPDSLMRSVGASLAASRQ